MSPLSVMVIVFESPSSAPKLMVPLASLPSLRSSVLIVSLRNPDSVQLAGLPVFVVSVSVSVLVSVVFVDSTKSPSLALLILQLTVAAPVRSPLLVTVKVTVVDSPAAASATNSDSELMEMLLRPAVVASRTAKPLLLVPL